MLSMFENTYHPSKQDCNVFGLEKRAMGVGVAYHRSNKYTYSQARGGTFEI